MPESNSERSRARSVDPIGRLPMALPSNLERLLSTVGALVLWTLTLGYIGGMVYWSVLIADSGDGLTGAVVFVAGFVGPPMVWALTSPRSRLEWALRWRAPELRTAIDHGEQALFLYIEEARADRRTPLDPTVRFDAMQPVWRIRHRDGAHLDESPSPLRPHVVRMPLRMVLTHRRFARRVDDWRAAVAYLERASDPGVAWLAAIACAEQADWRRAAEALRLLEERRVLRLVRVKLLNWMATEGALPARIAVAVVSADVEQLDRLLATPSEAPDALVELIEARWRADPDPDALTRWRADETLARALARLHLPGLPLDHWLALAAHRWTGVVLNATDTLIAEDSGFALIVARAALDRADLRAAVAALPTEQRHGLERLLTYVGENGELEDLRRLGGWSSAPGPTGRVAERERRQLQGRLEHPETTGGLALTHHEGPSGGLSTTPDER